MKQTFAQNPEGPWQTGISWLDELLINFNYTPGTYFNNGNGDWSYCPDCMAHVNLYEITVYGTDMSNTPVDLSLSDLWYSIPTNNLPQWSYWDFTGGVWTGVVTPTPSNPPPATTPSQIAQQIENKANINLATTHVSGVSDNATAIKNIQDVKNGLLASRSNYENAPGGQTELCTGLLQGIIQLAQSFSFSISEIAGGSHSVNSLHYTGQAIDVNYVNGIHVSEMNIDQIQEFRIAAYDSGATNVFDPVNEPTYHKNHFHIQWE